MAGSSNQFALENSWHMAPACQLIFDICRMFATWDEKVILKKLNPPSLLPSFLGWNRCQKSPNKVAKSGIWRILRKSTFFTFRGKKTTFEWPKIVSETNFPTNGGIFVYKGGLRISFMVPEVPKPRVNWRYWWHLQWCKISVSSVIVSRNKCEETM